MIKKSILFFTKCVKWLPSIFISVFILALVLVDKTNISNISFYPAESIFSEQSSNRIEFEKKSGNLLNNIDYKNEIFLEFNFKKENNVGIQNIFQTDPFNQGIRLEIIGKEISLITNDSMEDYKVFILKTRILNNLQYKFKIHAIDNYGFYVTLNDEKLKYYSLDFRFKGNNFLLGNGFDGKRAFSGIIDNSYYSSNYHQYKNQYELHSLVLYIKKYYSEMITALVWLFPILFFFTAFQLYFLEKNYRLISKIINIILLQPLKKIRLYINKNYNFDISVLLGPLLFTLVLLISLIIFIFIPAYLYFSLTYVFLFFVGIGFYITLLPKYVSDDNFALCFAPIFGVLATTILGGYFITLSLDIKYLMYLLPIYSTVLLFSSNARSRYLDIIFSTKTFMSKYYGAYIFIPIILIFFLLFPNIIYPETSFYRIGPDLSLYAKMTQFIVDGGLLSEAQQRLNEFSGLPVGEINKIGDATATWPFMYFFRWGLASFQSLVFFITPSTHIFQVSFLSLIFSHLSLGFIVFYWLYKAFNISKFISFLAALAIIFNSNLINLWYEGFYANFYSLFIYLFLMFLVFLIFLRNTELENYKKYDFFPIFVFLFLAALLSYPEGLIFIFGPVMAFLLFFEILIHRKINFSFYGMLISSFALAFIILLPSNYLIEWANLITRQLTEEGGNGFMQPHWALPHEILGIHNIYMNILPGNGGLLFERSIANYILSLTISILMLIPVLYYIKNNFRKINPILYISYLLVGIIAVFVFTNSRENNYLYMKYYIFMSPIILITLWVAIDFYQKKINTKGGAKKHFIYIMLTSVIALNGLTYIVKYTYFAESVSKEKIELYSETKHINFSNTVLYPYSYNGVLYSYASLIDAPWLTKDKYEFKHHKKYLNYKVYIFLKASDFKDNIVSKEIIFKNKEYVIIDSGYKLSYFIVNNIAIESILTNNK